MNQVKLNGANPETVANKIGGTLIAINGDTAIISGGNLNKLVENWLFEIGDTAYVEIDDIYYPIGTIAERIVLKGHRCYRIENRNAWIHEKDLYSQKDVDDIG